MSKGDIETLKKNSNYLRGDLVAEFANAAASLSADSQSLLKNHGMYQQDDRDQRQARRAAGQEPAYSFMLRSRIAGGKLTAAQYLAHDRIADQYGNGTMRLTTRQTFQLHGVLKGDVKATLQALHEELIITLAACGDVVRNVMSTPLPLETALHAEVQDFAALISDHFLPRSRAYYELWLGEATHESDNPSDGMTRVYDGQTEAGVVEPLYGSTYLPRKFKIGIAYPGDNSIDVYSQDIGLVVVAEHGQLRGFNVLVGGGLGMTHKNTATFPRLGDPLCYADKAQVLDVLTAIITVQRDHGDRTNRKHARLKYLVHDWGIEKFRTEVESRLGYTLAAWRAIPSFRLELYHGWQDQGNGKLFLGLSVQNGRIADQGTLRLKSGLRALLQAYPLNIRLTPAQDLLLTDIAPSLRPVIEALLAEYGIALPEALPMVQRLSMACPALPTCGLAIAEAERALPSVIQALDHELQQLGLASERLTVRMTGCPNGCARPYLADIAFVGRSSDKYMVYVGGGEAGDHLNFEYKDLVPTAELLPTLLPLLRDFKANRLPAENFGTFCRRVGKPYLQALAA